MWFVCHQSLLQDSILHPFRSNFHTNFVVVQLCN
jgi:hypothetical protein